MVNNLINKGKKILTSPQLSILSAASVIMLMVVASRVLGLIRQRALAHFFTPEELSLFFAAFRLPDTVFEVLVYGTFTSAFIPVFSRLHAKEEKSAWDMANSIVVSGVALFILTSVLLNFFSYEIYSFLTPGFVGAERQIVVGLSRILFLAQGFFVVSYVLTGTLESLKRFLVPALAPLFYNLGIILGTILLNDRFGLFAPVYGVVIGAGLHLLIQLPFAYKLGFRLKLIMHLDENVKKVGKLALPKIIEIIFIQASKAVELFLTTLISTASYTYFTFGNTLQLLPVSLFGTSIAKAALPTLSHEADDKTMFSKTLGKTLRQMFFIILPFATAFVVLDIPIVRLVYGTEIFNWTATLQTATILTAFAIGIPFQASSALLSRAFYALHDTKTPVIISIASILLVILLDFIFIRYLNLSAWGLALAFSIGSMVSTATLFVLLNRKLNGKNTYSDVLPFVKYSIASLISGSTMYVLLKLFDRSVWVKSLSFITNIETLRSLGFETFVLDTRYTANLLILTTVVFVVGLVVYIFTCFVLKVEEVNTYYLLIRKVLKKGKFIRSPIKESTSVPSSPTDSV